MQFDADYRILGQSSSIWCSLVQAGASWCRLVQLVAGWCSLMQIGVAWFSLVQLGADWCSLMQICAYWCSLMYLCAVWCRLVYLGADRCSFPEILWRRHRTILVWPMCLRSLTRFGRVGFPFQASFELTNFSNLIPDESNHGIESLKLRLLELDI